IRSGLLQALHTSWKGDAHTLLITARSLNRLLDLDLAIIEEAYQAENLLRQQRVERLATIGQVAGGIAHELRNPLNVVKTSVYYLLNARNPSAAKNSEHLHRIERQVMLCDGVITALANFARMGPPNSQPFSVQECLHEALEGAQLGSKIELTVDLPALP